jgi:hypothetical protein
MCESPNTVDEPGQLTDSMWIDGTGNFTVTQEFLVERQDALAIYWPTDVLTRQKLGMAR